MQATDAHPGSLINNRPLLRGLAALAWALLALPFCPNGYAFPPAPYHLVYGNIRDRYGSPLSASGVQVVLQTPSGIMIAGQIIPGFMPGVNYEIKVPMDAGQTPGPYQPNALFAGTTFKLTVVVSGVTNIPIEMNGSSVSLSEPGKSTRVDLTLGTDSNNDGLPDAWELAFLATLHLNIPLNSLNANLDLAHDGKTLRSEFLLGSYPFDPTRLCKISLLGFLNGCPMFSFPTVTGRYYSIQASGNSVDWVIVPFHLPGDAPGAAGRNYFYSPNITTVQATLDPPPAGTKAQFYRILVQ